MRRRNLDLVAQTAVRPFVIELFLVALRESSRLAGLANSWRFSNSPGNCVKNDSAKLFS
jgi:hypothetical protein